MSRFACGQAELDHWLREWAGRSEGRTARTYVVCDETSVVAYYCLAAGAVTHLHAPGKIRRNAPDPVPVIVIGRLAVDRQYARRGLGGALLKDGLLRCLNAGAIVGARAVLVHAIDDDAVRFYLHYGFAPFPPGSRTLFLPMETIAVLRAT